MAAVTAGCGPETDALLPYGTGAVVGSAFGGTDFSYGATEVRVLADRLEDGSVQLNVSLCERACEPFGVGIADDSRALTLTVLSPEATLAAGGRFNFGPALDGFAVHRPPAMRPEQSQRETRLDQMITGSEVTLEPFTFTPGSTIRGSFSVLLQSNGALTGQFEAPLVILGEPIPAP